MERGLAFRLTCVLRMYHNQYQVHAFPFTACMQYLHQQLLRGNHCRNTYPTAQGTKEGSHLVCTYIRQLLTLQIWIKPIKPSLLQVLLSAVAQVPLTANQKRISCWQSAKRSLQIGRMYVPIFVFHQRRFLRQNLTTKEMWSKHSLLPCGGGWGEIVRNRADHPHGGSWLMQCERENTQIMLRQFKRNILVCCTVGNWNCEICTL